MRTLHLPDGFFALHRYKHGLDRCNASHRIQLLSQWPVPLLVRRHDCQEALSDLLLNTPVVRHRYDAIKGEGLVLFCGTIGLLPITLGCVFALIGHPKP